MTLSSCVPLSCFVLHWLRHLCSFLLCVCMSVCEITLPSVLSCLYKTGDLASSLSPQCKSQMSAAGQSLPPPPFFLDRYFPPPSERPFVLYIIGFSLQVISTTHSAVIAQMKITWIPKVAATCCAVAVSSFCSFCCGGGEGFFFLSRFFFKVFKSDKKQNLLAKQKRKFPPDKGTKIFSPSDSM